MSTTNVEEPAQPTATVEPNPNAPVTFSMVQTGFQEFERLINLSISKLTDRIDNLTSNPNFANNPTPLPPSIPAPQPEPVSNTNSRGTPKFKEPTVFTGKGTQVVGFIQEIDDTLHLLRNTYTTNKDKCIYLTTYLGEGTPKEWYKSILIEDRELTDSEKHLNDFQKFKNAFISHFGDSNLVDTAMNKIDG